MTHAAGIRVRIIFDASLPHGRWGPLFHVFRLEHPAVQLDWQTTGFPIRARPLLDGADVGLLLEPLQEPGLNILTLEVSRMDAIVAVGDRLAHHDSLCVADILDRPFPGGLDPNWTSPWTLDQQRGGPAHRTGDDVTTIEDALRVVADGQAITTLPAWVADGLTHPGVLAIPLRDAPPVRTCLVWRTDDGNPFVRSLVDLATAWTHGAPARR